MEIVHDKLCFLGQQKKKTATTSKQTKYKLNKILIGTGNRTRERQHIPTR